MIPFAAGSCPMAKRAKGSTFQKKHGGIDDGRKAGGGGGTEVYHDEQCSYRQPRKDAMSLPLQ